MNNQPKEITGKGIRKLRDQHHMTRRDLAEKTQIPQKTITNYEMGISEPSYSNVEKICQALGTSTEVLRQGGQKQIYDRIVKKIKAMSVKDIQNLRKKSLNADKAVVGVSSDLIDQITVILQDKFESTVQRSYTENILYRLCQAINFNSESL